MSPGPKRSESTPISAGRPRWRKIVVALAIVVAVLVIVTAIVIPRAMRRGGTHSHAATPGQSLVTVTKQNISPVLTLPVTMVAQPHYEVSSSVAGQVKLGPAKVNTLVPAGALLFSVTGQEVKAPADCYLLAWLSPEVSISAGIPVASCAYPGFGMSGQIPNADAYRIMTGSLHGRAEINDGPGPFDCPILIAPKNTADRSGLSVTCAVPATVRGVVDVQGMLAIQSDQVTDALVLPRTAIRGLADHGIVGVLVNGIIVTRDVDLGVTDGVYVQIRHGLNEGDRVLATAPALTDR